VFGGAPNTEPVDGKRQTARNLPFARMKASDVEAWVVRVLERLQRGERHEDDRVELKLELPDDPSRAARRIAGHANQARQERILWIIGATDREGADPIPGLTPHGPDAADWWKPVEARFDEVSPNPTFALVHFEDRLVLGIGFDTSRPPYVVKVRGDGQDREVPWREATSVRSAKRHDLVRLLVPLTDLPVITVIGGYLSVNQVDGNRWQWFGAVEVYAEVMRPVYLPDHWCEASATFAGQSFTLMASCSTRARSMPPSIRHSDEPMTVTADRGEDQLLVHAPGPIRVILSRQTGFMESPVVQGATGRIEATLVAAGLDRRTMQVEATLRPDEPEGSAIATWRIHPV
jgi:hypothetical protein